MRKNLSHFSKQLSKLTLGILGLTTLFCAHDANAQVIWARGANTLSSFNATSPGTIISTGTITGIMNPGNIAGMDFRPSTGQMYIMEYNATSGAAQLYTVNTSTFAATPIGASFTLATGMSNIGFDFNPAVDRIRITSQQGNNYRVHPATGVLLATDGMLDYQTGDVNDATMPMVGSVAYTNSYIGATSTVMYTFDDAINTLAASSNPNAGSLSTVGMNAISEVGGATGELDIYYDATTMQNVAFFETDVNTSGGVSQLFAMNLSTGQPVLIGTIATPYYVQDLACQINFNPSTAIAGRLLYGLTSNGYLISFDSEMPSTVRTHRSISGITAGQTLVGLDSRPNTGQYYGLGYNSSTGDAQLYTLDVVNGIATSVAAPVVLATGMSNVSFDFNPTVDRIRVTSSQDHNYRLHPVTGAIVATDGSLAYNVTDVNNGQNPNIGAGAYTNSYIAATSTGLYGYDVSLNVLTLQNPPNNGVLNTIGGSGIMVNSTDPSVDFDSYYDTLAMTNTNYMIANVGASSFDNLYTLNLTTGAATLVGQVGNGSALVDVVAPITVYTPAMIMGELVYGITSNQYLISFDNMMPGKIRSHLSISGITAGQTIEGLDVRPATGELYAVGYNVTNGLIQLYTIAPATGVATSVAVADTIGSGIARLGVDFNPTVDRIRVVGSNGSNYRLHPTTGIVVAVDGNLAYSATDANAGTMPNVATGAYTNSFGGSNNTKLFVYDDALNILALQNPPNNGTLNTIGTSGLMQSTTDVTSDIDIYYNHSTHMNEGYMVSNASLFDTFYMLNTSTGAATSVGMIGYGTAVKDIAVRNSVITTLSSTASTISATACESYTAPNNMVYTASGTYQAIIPNAAMYDSLITINLTVNQPSMNTISPTVCDMYTAPDGMMYMTSGTYMATLTNAVGCDSIITINLTVNEMTMSTISPSTCDTYTAPDGMMYTTSGTYMATIPNAAGCDSVITINLTVNTVDNGISMPNDTTLMAAQMNGMYQWIDCATNQPVAGATMMTFTPMMNGSYAVVVTSPDGCSDTSACMTISKLSLDEAVLVNQIYPNPTTDKVTVVFNQVAPIQVKDAMGRTLMTIENTSLKQEISLSEFTFGMYYIQVGNQVYSIVKQ